MLQICLACGLLLLSLSQKAVDILLVADDADIFPSHDASLHSSRTILESKFILFTFKEKSVRLLFRFLDFGTE